jgi:cation diffusion facilitator family transporter
MLSVLVALAANLGIATAKGIAAALTGSAALFAETLHSVADAGNEVLLYIAVRRSERPPDAIHPFGHGAERYYWALLAAIGMFLIGGAVSIWEGIQAVVSPRTLDYFWVGVGVLLFALVLDGLSRLVALRQLRAEAGRRGISLRTLLRESPDPALTTVYLEDSTDVIGALLALGALTIHKTTGAAWPDGVATILIGCLLALVAVRLARRNRQLITNQAVPPRYVERLRRRLEAQAGIEAVSRLDAVYLGAREVLVAADVLIEPDLDGEAVARSLADARAQVLQEAPVVARIYLTPVPHQDSKGAEANDRDHTDRPGRVVAERSGGGTETGQ